MNIVKFSAESWLDVSCLPRSAMKSEIIKGKISDLNSLLLSIRSQLQTRGQISEDSNGSQPPHMASAGTVGPRWFIEPDAISTRV